MKSLGRTDPGRPRRVASWWGGFLEKIVLPAGDVAFGQRMMRRWKFLRSAQWWPRERIIAYQEERLQQLLSVANQECPFYRRLWAEAGVDLSKISSADDLERLPIVSKRMLQQAQPDDLRRVNVRRFYYACSSGSTGEPVQIAEDRMTAGEYRAAFLLALEWAGWRLGEPSLQTGMNLQRDFARRLKDLFLRTAYVSAYDLRDNALVRILDLLDKRRIAFLMGYPGSLEALARCAERRGFSRALRAVITWGDMLLPSARARIERTFSTRVFDTYGLGEGIQVAAQCGNGLTYHVQDTETLVEIVDEAGRCVSPGEPGRIVLTRLHPGCTPLIRYDSMDLGSLDEQRSCPCGRELRILKSLLGRQGDVIVTPSGNRLIVHFFTGILEYFPEIVAFQVRQESLLSGEILIVPGKSWREETGTEVIRRLRERGADLAWRIKLVKEIPLTSAGKHRFVLGLQQE